MQNPNNPPGYKTQAEDTTQEKRNNHVQTAERFSHRKKNPTDDDFKQTIEGDLLENHGKKYSILTQRKYETRTD